MKKFQKVAYVAMGLLMGLSVAFTPSAFASSGTKTLQATFRNIKIVVDGKAVTPKDGNGNVIEPFVVDGTTYLPVRAVGEALGKPVNWDGNTNTVTIGTASSAPTPAPANETGGTVKLSDLDYFTKDGMDILEHKEQVNINTGDYLSDCYIRSFYDGTSARGKGTVDYLINGQYAKITGTIFLDYEGRATSGKSKFRIWGDEKLIYESDEIKTGFMPKPFEVNISGVNTLKIGMEIIGYDSAMEAASSNFGISNVTLQKK